MKVQQYEQLLANPNVKAFLFVIRSGEGTLAETGYRTLFGGGLFSSFADHPNMAISRTLGGKPITSTAAGAYQFLSKTWSMLVQLHGFKDFSPHNQDLGAVALIDGRRALQDVVDGNFESAVAKCNKEWASLPGSPYGQPTLTLDRAKQLYLAAGGQLTPAVPVTPPAVPVTPAVPAVEKPMGPLLPFASILLPEILKAAPDLIRIVNDPEKTVRDRNGELLNKVLTMTGDALGTQNPAEIIDVVKTPEGQQKVQEAVRQNYFDLAKLSEGLSVKESRDFAIQYAQLKNVRTLFGKWFRITFLEFLSLVFVLIGGAGGFVVLAGTTFGGEMKSAVVTLMLIGGYTGVKEFWLGRNPKEDDGSNRPS